MAPKTEPLYSLKNRQFKEKIIQAILSDPEVGKKADRAIDIIIQTPDKEIIPFIENSFYANKTPQQLVNALKTAESTIFNKYRVFPWEELHHETSLVSLRDIRQFSLDDQVKALNAITQAVGAPGNSRANLALNSLDRRSHTGGMTIAKTQSGQRMSELFNLPSGEKQYSGHPFGTDARKDPSGIFVEAGSDVDNWINRAIESVNQQKESAKQARRQSLPQRLVINKMLNTASGAPSQSQLDIYSGSSTPEERQAALKFFKQPSSEKFRVSGVKAWAPFLSQAGQQRFQIPENAAWLESLSNRGDYFAGLPMPSKQQLGSLVSDAKTGIALSALNPEVAQAVDQNNLGAAGSILAKNAALGVAGEMGIKAALPLAGKYAPAITRVGGVAGAAGTGAALFSQGQSGSLTDVITRKAAQNPVSFMPSLKANPETDIGARASRAITNEAKYLSNQATKVTKPLMKAIKNELTWLQREAQKRITDAWSRTIRKPGDV